MKVNSAPYTKKFVTRFSLFQTVNDGPFYTYGHLRNQKEKIDCQP